MMRRRAAVLASVVASLAACDVLVEKDRSGPMVSTYEAPGGELGRFRTFAVVRAPGLVAAEAVESTVEAPALVARVRSALEARGLREVAVVDPLAPPAAAVEADLAVNVTALGDGGAAPDVWASSPGHVAPAAFGSAAAAWSYPWAWSFPPRAGSILVELGELGAGGAALPVVWAALASGVAPGGAWEGPAALAAIDQAFRQAPGLAAAGAP